MLSHATCEVPTTWYAHLVCAYDLFSIKHEKKNGKTGKQHGQDDKQPRKERQKGMETLRKHSANCTFTLATGLKHFTPELRGQTSAERTPWI